MSEHVMPFVFFLMTLLYTTKQAYLPDLKEGYSFKYGDLILGGIFPLADDCNNRKVDNFGLVQLAEAMPFAVKKINADAILPNNIKLGYVIFDSCFSDRNALAQTLYMIPDKNPNATCQEQQTCANPYFDVVGVIGPQTSSGAVLQSHLLANFHTPQISAYATNDALSEKSRYPYFLRTVPTDKWQIIALVELIRHFNWTYLSAVRQQGSYGDGLKQVQDRLTPYGVCFAVVKEVSESPSKEEVSGIVNALVANNAARVVIFYSWFSQALDVMKEMDSRKVLGDFVIVGSDGLGMLVLDTRMSPTVHLTHGILVATQYSNVVPDFDSYFQSLNTSYANSSFLLKTFWEHKFKCSMTGSNRCPSGLRITAQNGFFSYRPVSMVIDAVYSFAYALRDLIQNVCPNANTKTVRSCIKGDTLLAYLKNVSFDGNLGRIKFDKNGDIVGKYEIRNVYKDNDKYDSRRVAVLDTATNNLQVSANLIQWHKDFEHFVPGTNRTPETVCSKPCPPGYQRIHKSVSCCWDCRPCRGNERTNSQGTDCIPCPMYQWPEQTTFRKCVEIIPDHITWDSTLAIIMSILSSMGIVACVSVAVIYFKTRREKLIKASSIELMYLILAGAVLSLVIVFTLLAQPTGLTCLIIHCGFSISFTLSYAPLLTKTRRIYVIFDSGKKSKEPPKFISTSAQLVICCILTLLQVILTVVSEVLDPATPMRYMPSETKPYVELGCYLPSWGLMASLCYNICLVLACTYYAVRARKVPENFNESRFISFNVYTTLVLWLAFIPTYFTSSSEMYKVLFLSVVMIVNCFVILILLFIPKLYAVFYVSDDDLKFLQTTIAPANGHAGRRSRQTSQVDS